ncbi:MAG: OmpA family protein [Acidobacteriota bacterium]
MSPRPMLWKNATLAAAIVLLSATGCHKNSSTLPPPGANAPSSELPPPTASITADPLAIDLGQSVVLNWRTTNATAVTIDGIGQVSVNGTQTVSPSNSTNFHLVAKGDGGTTEANVRVTVRVAELPPTPANTTGTEGDMGSEAAFHTHVKDLYFDYDSFTLRGDAQSAIEEAARYLAANPSIKILIAGYCDDRGSAEYNITLGENRANSAKSALLAAGVAPGRIRVVSYGKERQFCTDETEACWQSNRRDQFTLDR